MKKDDSRNLDIDKMSDSSLITVEECAALCRAGVSTTWRRMKSDPTFPRAVRLGNRCTRIQVGALKAWLRSKAGV